MNDKIIIAGGTGYLGRVLTGYFIKNKDRVYIITRQKTVFKNKINYINWNDNWQKELESAKAIINLTGKSINCLFNKRNKKEILSSRINATNLLNEAINACKIPPKIFINASGAAIYKYCLTTIYDENNTTFGNSYLSKICQQWETIFYETETPNTRKVAIRITPVLGKGATTIRVIKKIVNLGLGGKQGNGKQYFSWIHESDFVCAIVFIIENKEIKGSVNMTAPNAVSNAQFMRSFRKILKIPFGIPTPNFLLNISKYITKTEPELILESSHLIPEKLKNAGFKFIYPTIEVALSNLFTKASIRKALKK